MMEVGSDTPQMCFRAEEVVPLVVRVPTKGGQHVTALLHLVDPPLVLFKIYGNLLGLQLYLQSLTCGFFSLQKPEAGRFIPQQLVIST